MPDFLIKFDALAGIETENFAARWLERTAFGFLVLMVLFAPHSIAASQTAWLAGMFAWFIRLFIKPRPKFFRTALNIPLWTFFGWSVVSAVFSYAPDISIDKLRGAAIFSVFYFVINNLRNSRAVRFLAFALVFSCMVNVLWMPVQRLIGRGVEIHGVAEQSPLAKALLFDGDALLEANGKKLNTPEDLVAQIEQTETSKVKFYRPDFEFVVDISREDLLNGANATEKLGIESWKKSRNWRSSGFFGHYATYAEVLQLIISLVFGIFIGFLMQSRKDPKSRSWSFVLFVCLCGMGLALLLTVTRASQLAFMISAFSIVLLNGNRKLLLSLAAIALPIALVGLIFLQQTRNVGFIDSTDNSTSYRQTVYREGFDLWTSSARNFTVGVGMDSIKRYAKDWHLFDDGRLPMGHFHSTPLQLVVERGLPALLIWLWIVGIYARTLLRYLKFQIPDSRLKGESGIWNVEFGIILGCFGGLIGFFTSGLVHYNLGDQEVALVFFLLMALSVFLCNSKFHNSNSK